MQSAVRTVVAPKRTVAEHGSMGSRRRRWRRAWPLTLETWAVSIAARPAAAPPTPAGLRGAADSHAAGAPPPAARWGSLGLDRLTPIRRHQERVAGAMVASSHS